MVLIKFAYLSLLNCMRDRILSLVSVQGTNGGQNYEKLIQYFIIPLHLMCWLSMLSKLDCFFFYFLLYIVQYVDNQLVICNYLPMQKCWNIFCSTISFVTSPAMSLKWKMHSLMSWATKSPERLFANPCCTRPMASKACVRAS